MPVVKEKAASDECTLDSFTVIITKKQADGASSKTRRNGCAELFGMQCQKCGSCVGVVARVTQFLPVLWFIVFTYV